MVMGEEAFSCVRNLKKPDVFMSTCFYHPDPKKPMQFRNNVESTSSVISNVKQGNKDDGKIHLKWKSEYDIMDFVR